MSNWYTIIARDVSKIPEAIKHFETELQSARYEIKIKVVGLKSLRLNSPVCIGPNIGKVLQTFMT